MSNYNSLKATINANIKTNGNEEITGSVLNSVLNAMVNTLGAGYQYAGVATPDTNPGTPDTNVFYIAATAGTYTNMGGLVVSDGEVAILKYNGTWTKDVTGVVTAEKVSQLQQEVTNLSSRKADKRYGVNIVDPSVTISGYLNRYGDVGPNDGLIVSDYIPVSVGQGVRVFKKASSSSAILTFAAYDSGFAFVRGVYNSNEYTQQGDEAYIRITLTTPTTEYPTHFANYGTTLLPYEPYEDIKTALTNTQEDVKNAYNIKGIFTRESDFSNYNGVRIYDISANKNIPETYKIGLGYIGKNDSTHIDIILTKDGLPITSSVNYLAELYVPISSLAQDEIQTLTIPAKNPTLYGGVEYYITLNVTDLISTSGVAHDCIFFDKDYINNKMSIPRIEEWSMNHLNSITSLPLHYVDKFKCVKRFDIFLPEDLADKDWKISELVVQQGLFFAGIYYYENDARVWLYGQTSSTAFSTIPTSGVSKIPFESYYIDKAGRRYDVEMNIEIDWSIFTNPIISLQSDTNIKISPITKSVVEQSLIDGGVISGEISLDSNIVIPNCIQVYGNDCVVNLNGHTITLSENSGLHNIKFVGDWDINRTIDDTKESGFAPSLTINDIKGVLSDISALGNPSIIITGAHSQNTQIDGCTFYKIGGIAVKASSEAQRSNQQPLIANCYFNECKCGLHISGEFMRVNNCFFDNCYYGYYVQAGNSNICNCDVKRCDCGILMKGGLNGMHGQMANIEVAHCLVVGLFVRDTSTNLGFVFNGCQFADASIESDECHSLMFSGCRMETWFKIDAGSKNSIHNSIFSKAYATKYKVPFLDFPADTSLMGNRGISGCTDMEVNNNVLNP